MTSLRCRRLVGFLSLLVFLGPGCSEQADPQRTPDAAFGPGASLALESEPAFWHASHGDYLRVRVTMQNTGSTTLELQRDGFRLGLESGAAIAAAADRSQCPSAISLSPDGTFSCELFFLVGDVVDPRTISYQDAAIPLTSASQAIRAYDEACQRAQQTTAPCYDNELFYCLEWVWYASDEPFQTCIDADCPSNIVSTCHCVASCADGAQSTTACIADAEAQCT